MSSRRNWKKYIGLAGMLFLFPLAWVLFFGVFSSHHFNTLPYYGPDAREGADTSGYHLPPFRFANQEGDTLTADSLRGKVWIATWYSLGDPQIPKITQRLLMLNWRYRNEPDILIVCFSTDTTSGQESAQRKYVLENTRYNAHPGKWQFLHGDSTEAGQYVRDGFFVRDIRSEARFRLVDPNGQVRGLYGNTEHHMERAMEDIALLKKEIDKRKYRDEHKSGQVR